MINDPRPYTRWWWFSGTILNSDIDNQLDWIAEQEFGGVEIAWVYPQKGTDPGDGARFLEPDFMASIHYAAEGCRVRGLGVDLTFGSLWPFNGTFIPEEHTSKTLSGFSDQNVDRSWESRYSADPSPVLDHVSREALEWYAGYLLDKGFSEVKAGSFFCDSWEVDPILLGYEGIFEDFYKEYGYELTPCQETLDSCADVRFDYRKLLSDKILSSFYGPYREICHKAGTLARVQCHGAPTDILAAYGLSDIPETETLLFDPDFALIAASAAAMTDKPVVSSESFTCLYGWIPSGIAPPGMGEEQIRDLRCVADAQFAWGVNRVVWHGMPFSTEDRPARFYATVHVGPDGGLAPYLPSFNRYLAAVSDYMSRGESVSRLAVYLPLEDQWMRDEVPDTLKKPSSNWHWELQELKMDYDLLPYRPLWFSASWLEELEFTEGKLLYHDRDIGALYCDSEWMLCSSLEKLTELVEAGAPVIFNRLPEEPGKVRHEAYDKLTGRIQNSHMTSLKDIPPLIKSDVSLEYWCRREGDKLFFFFAHPQMQGLRYPMPYGYGDTLKEQSATVEIFPDIGSESPYTLNLEFGAVESLLYEVDTERGSIRRVELDFL